MLREQVELQRVMLINQDPPEHTATRQIISRGFTPRAIGALDDIMKQRAEKIVRDALERGEGNFVEEVACELPLQAIADFIGVPQEDRRKLFDWSNQMLAYDDPDVDGDPDVAAAEILGYSMEMAADRKANPRDDIVTKLVHADKDGRGPQRRRVRLLRDHPDRRRQRDHPQRDHARHERLPRQPRPVGALEARAPRDDGRRGDPLGDAGELVPAHRAQRRRGRRGRRSRRASGSGCSTPAPTSTTTSSSDPHTFDITRNPNPHVAFGGHGAHYCIGANLARQEVKLMFNALADLAPDITKTGEPRRLRSGWINGIKDLPGQVRLSVAVRRPARQPARAVSRGRSARAGRPR